MVQGGVPAEKITVVDQPLDLARFSPAHAASGAGVLRLCYAGSVDVRKGVFNLLRAMRAMHGETRLVIVGSTGARAVTRVLARERAGLDVTVAPGDPVPAYRASDLFVLPTLEDGFGFVVAEAMGCGLPVVVTDKSGAAEWVARAGAGWVVPAGDEGALARAIEEARARRGEFAAMGERARAYVAARASGERCFAALRDFAWRRGEQ
jgi:glycosyltransferase involved in cell wall biosynthesis